MELVGGERQTPGLLARGYNGKWLEVEAHVISESELGLVTHFPMNQVYVSAVLWSHIHTLTTSANTHTHTHTYIHTHRKHRAASGEAEQYTNYTKLFVIVCVCVCGGPSGDVLLTQIYSAHHVLTSAGPGINSNHKITHTHTQWKTILNHTLYYQCACRRRWRSPSYRFPLNLPCRTLTQFHPRSGL